MSSTYQMHSYLSLLKNPSDKDEHDGDSGCVPDKETRDQKQLGVDDREVEQKQCRQYGGSHADDEAERAHYEGPRPGVAAGFVVVTADQYQWDCPLGLGSTLREVILRLLPVQI